MGSTFILYDQDPDRDIGRVLYHQFRRTTNLSPNGQGLDRSYHNVIERLGIIVPYDIHRVALDLEITRDTTAE